MRAQVRRGQDARNHIAGAAGGALPDLAEQGEREAGRDAAERGVHLTVAAWGAARAVAVGIVGAVAAAAGVGMTVVM